MRDHRDDGDVTWWLGVLVLMIFVGVPMFLVQLAYWLLTGSYLGGA